MKSTLSLFCAAAAIAAAPAAAGPLEERKVEAHLQAVAAGDIEALMRDYAEDADMDWVGGPLDGRYRGRAAIREVWKKFAALNDGQPRPARFDRIVQQANPKGVTLASAAEYGGKNVAKVWHVLVYRDGELTTEIWQIAPALKVAE
jgi:ketosteroid isomerase-like protein